MADTLQEQRDAILQQVLANAAKTGAEVTQGADQYGNNAAYSIRDPANAPVTQSSTMLFLGMNAQGQPLYRNTRTGAITIGMGGANLNAGSAGTNAPSATGIGQTSTGGGTGGSTGGGTMGGGASGGVMPTMGGGGTTTPPVSPDTGGSAGSALGGLASLGEQVPDTEVIKAVGSLSSLRGGIGNRILPDATPILRPRLY